MELFNFISNWVIVLFFIWLLLYTCDKNNKLLEYLNLYYLNLLIWYGYIGYLLIHILVLKTEFNIIFTILNIIIHYLPIYVYQKLNIKPNKHSFYLFILIFFIYLCYIHKILNKNMIQIYLIDKQITN